MNRNYGSGKMLFYRQIPAQQHRMAYALYSVVYILKNVSGTVNMRGGACLQLSGGGIRRHANIENNPANFKSL